MRVDISPDEAVKLVCDGKVVAEVIGDKGTLESAYHEREISEARVAVVLLYQLRKVTDWQAFLDGVNNVTRSHPASEIPDYVGPHKDEKGVNPERVKEYKLCWQAGEYVRRFLVDDQMDLFGGGHD